MWRWNNRTPAEIEIGSQLVDALLMS